MTDWAKKLAELTVTYLTLQEILVELKECLQCYDECDDGDARKSIREEIESVELAAELARLLITENANRRGENVL